MALTAYCAYDEVRAALGVNSDELGNPVLALPVYEMGLVRELNKISTSLPAAFSTVAAKSVSSRTSQEESLFQATHLFAVYAVAKQAGVALPSFMPKSVTDGKAGVSRFAGEPYELTMRNVEAMYSELRKDLIDVYAAYVGGAVTEIDVPTTFIAVARNTDPVTGT